MTKALSTSSNYSVEQLSSISRTSALCEMVPKGVHRRAPVKMLCCTLVGLWLCFLAPLDRLFGDMDVLRQQQILMNDKSAVHRLRHRHAAPRLDGQDQCGMLGHANCLHQLSDSKSVFPAGTPPSTTQKRGFYFRFCAGPGVESWCSRVRRRCTRQPTTT